MSNFLRRIGSGLTFKVGDFSITLDVSLLLLTPVTLWLTATAYVPIMGTAATTFEAWMIAVVITFFMFLSIAVHSLAHICVTGRTGPKQIYLSPLGDPAQSHPAASKAGRETLTALAGPFIQFVLAVLFYIVWNLQINTFITVTAFFLIFFNLALAAVNLTPVFPFDGGRVLRAVIWKLLGRPGAATRLAGQLGWSFAAGLAGWGIFLLVQSDRFSLVTAGATFFVGILVVVSLLAYKVVGWEKPEGKTRYNLSSRVFRSAAAVLLILPLAVISLSLIPLNQGLEAPGFTAPVEPMVQVPAEYRHESIGSLILVTVIPQAPIIAGEWIYARFDRSIRITTQEEIVPESKTAQKVTQENYQMLLDSEATAVIVGLRLAGWTIEVNNTGVRILSVLESSPAIDILQPDDVITSINRNTVITPADLTGLLRSLPSGSILKMEIRRGGSVLLLDVPTMNSDGMVKIGITIEQYSAGYTLPFPVDIVPEKVNGGPSAGLMFTLAVYDLTTENDLTGGRKIAGTGTIDLNGNVGPIGGVRQKVVAAERAGAEYFLCPEENYEDAVATATHIEVIKVKTAQEAIDFLKSL
jgi:Lon-like protease